MGSYWSTIQETEEQPLFIIIRRTSPTKLAVDDDEEIFPVVDGVCEHPLANLMLKLFRTGLLPSAGMGWGGCTNVKFREIMGPEFTKKLEFTLPKQIPLPLIPTEDTKLEYLWHTDSGWHYSVLERKSYGPQGYDLGGAFIAHSYRSHSNDDMEKWYKENVTGGSKYHEV